MGTVYLQDSTLTAIGNAIRSKTGESGLLLPSQMPSAIQGITTGGGGGTGDINVKDILENAISIESLNYYGLLDEYYNQNSIELNLAPTKVGGSSTFRYSTLCDDISVDIDMSGMGSGSTPFNYFMANSDLKKLDLTIHDIPSGFRFTQIGYLCYDSRKLKEVNDDIFDFVSNMTAMTNKSSSLFQNCFSLKKLPNSIHKLQINSKSTSMYWGLSGLYSLKRLDIPICMSTHPDGFMAYQSDFSNLSSLEHFIITNPNNVQYTGAVSSSATYLTLNLSNYVGYFNGTSYANQIDDIKDGTRPRVSTDAEYEQYKNEDYWTTSVLYSKYNKPAAIETLQSLPDMSGWGFTFTIKFQGSSGQKTDGGAINSMTDEEIAIATDKNWTVQFV